MPFNILIEKFLCLPIANKAAWVVATSCFFACCILILVDSQGDNRLIQRSSQLFGDSLIQQLARDASNPLVQGDKLSLQSLLNQLVASPMVIRAAVYDVENHPIAEAGDPAKGKSLSASITFQDSIAGYALITLDATPLKRQASQLAWQLLGLALLLAGGGYVVGLLAARQISAVLNDLRVIASAPIKQRNSRIAYAGEDELQQLAQQILAGTLNTGSINSSHNIIHHPLGQAVIAIRFDQTDITSSTLNELQRQLHTICKLYEGELRVNRSDSLCIIFRPEDEDQSYPFRALCSGLLILSWLELHNKDIKINHLGLVADTEFAVTDTSLGQQLKQQQLLERAINLTHSQPGFIADLATCQHSSIKERLICSVTDDDNQQVIIEALQEPYNALLERQFKALSAT